jgi:hypothetical protein
VADFGVKYWNLAGIARKKEWWCEMWPVSSFITNCNWQCCWWPGVMIWRGDDLVRRPGTLTWYADLVCSTWRDGLAGGWSWRYDLAGGWIWQGNGSVEMTYRGGEVSGLGRRTISGRWQCGALTGASCNYSAWNKTDLYFHHPKYFWMCYSTIGHY